MDDLKVREAVADDRDDVIKIRENLYGGSDYLPAYFQHFVDSTDITPFVLLYQDKVVGYVAAQIVDDGQTLVTRAARVTPETEGKGFYGYMNKHVEEWARSKHVQTKAFMTTDANTSLSKCSFQSVNKMTTATQFLVYVTDAEKLLQLPDNVLESDVATVSDDVLATYFSSSAIKQYLFPKDRVIADYIPCKLLESNIRFMKGPGDFTTRLSDVQADGDHCAGLLSFGTVYLCKENTILHCVLEIYGRSTSSFRKHVMKHLSMIKQRAFKAGIHNALVKFAINMEKGVSDEELDKIFNEFNISRRISSYLESFSWEKNL